MIRGDPTDDSYVTKLAIHSTIDGVEWSKINEQSLDDVDQLVFAGNEDSTSIKKVKL